MKPLDIVRRVGINGRYVGIQLKFVIVLSAMHLLSFTFSYDDKQNGEQEVYSYCTDLFI